MTDTPKLKAAFDAEMSKPLTILENVVVSLTLLEQAINEGDPARKLEIRMRDILEEVQEAREEYELDDTRTDRNIARQRIAELEEGLHWRPIITAPRDGTHILACDASMPYSATWTFNQRPPTVVHYWDGMGAPDAGFYTSVNELAPENTFPATHWRPLGPMPEPASPESEATPEPDAGKDKRIAELEDSHRNLCVRVAMLEMVVSDLLDELIRIGSADRVLQQIRGFLPCNNDLGNAG
jgi:hypothetical protein